MDVNCTEAVQKKQQHQAPPDSKPDSDTDSGSDNDANVKADRHTSSQSDEEDPKHNQAVKTTQAYLERNIDMIRDNIENMPSGSCFVLLVPTELFFHATLFKFMFSFSLDLKGNRRNAKTRVPEKLAEQLHEMKVHADFMRVFVPFYIHPHYAETASIVQRRSKFFFAHHRAVLE